MKFSIKKPVETTVVSLILRLRESESKPTTASPEENKDREYAKWNPWNFSGAL